MPGIVHKFNLEDKAKGHHKTQPLRSIEEEHFGIEGTWDNMGEMMTFALKGQKLA